MSICMKLSRRYHVQDESMKGKVVEVVEKGYWLNDKVMRYSKVVVGNKMNIITCKAKS